MADFRQQVLAQREWLNQQFQLWQYQHPHLNGKLVQEFMAQQLAPLLAFEADEALLRGGYTQILHYGALRWLDDKQYRPHLEVLWQQVLPLLLPLLKQQPQLWAQLNNLLAQLPPVARGLWLNQLRNLAPLCDADNYQQLLVISLWLQGQSQWRGLATQLWLQLPAPLSAQLLAAYQLTVPLETLLTQPWWGYHAGDEVARVGATTLLGGKFGQPPLVCQHAGQLYVQSGELCYRLHADRFGTALERISYDENLCFITERQQIAHQLNFLALQQLAITPADIGAVSSIAMNKHTIALTSSDSFAVLLFHRGAL